MLTDVHREAAEALEKVLLQAVAEGNGDVIAFCRKQIYPLYSSHLRRSKLEHPELKRVFAERSPSLNEAKAPQRTLIFGHYADISPEVAARLEYDEL